MSRSADYLRILREHQSVHGHGTKPRKSQNPALSNWFCDRLRVFRRLQSTTTSGCPPVPDDIAALADLGLISLNPDDPLSPLAPQAKVGRQRGFAAAAQELISRCRTNTLPSLADGSYQERHLALWNLRIQAGILANNQTGTNAWFELPTPAQQLVEAYAEHAANGNLAREWVLFCARVGRLSVFPRIRPDTWHARLIAPSHETLLRDAIALPMHPRLPTILSNIANPATVHSAAIYAPSDVISYLNRMLDASPRYQTFSPGRVRTQEFAKALASHPVCPLPGFAARPRSVAHREFTETFQPA